MGRSGGAALSRTVIARAALELIDERGHQALTMRLLAERLGVRGASLYRYVDSKEDILDAVSALLDEEIDHSPLHLDPWTDGIAGYARGYRRVFRRHPNTIVVIARRTVQSERALLEYDTLLDTLIRAGCTPDLAVEAAAAIDYLVLGSALETFAAGFDLPPDHYRPAYPALAASLEAVPHDGPGSLDDRGFELGLALILDGLARQLREGPPAFAREIPEQAR